MEALRRTQNSGWNGFGGFNEDPEFGCCATHRAARLRRSRNQDLTAECVHGRWWRSGCKVALLLACLQRSQHEWNKTLGSVSALVRLVTKIQTSLVVVLVVNIERQTPLIDSRS